jgi:uncharacterized protein YabN with tetrapyrrole methylase and pyrophosphatase domain
MHIWQRLKHLEESSCEFGLAWPDAMTILQQIESECKEIREHLEKETCDKNALQEEIGDLLHAATSLAWFCQFDAQQTLSSSCDKFEKRLDMMKKIAADQGLQHMKGQSFQELLQIWDEAKRRLLGIESISKR